MATRKSQPHQDAATADGLVAASKSFTTMVGRAPRVIHRGDLYRADDELVMAQPERFGPPKVHTTAGGPRRVTGTPTGRIDQREKPAADRPADAPVGLTMGSVPTAATGG